MPHIKHIKFVLGWIEPHGAVRATGNLSSSGQLTVQRPPSDSMSQYTCPHTQRQILCKGGSDSRQNYNSNATLLCTAPKGTQRWPYVPTTLTGVRNERQKEQSVFIFSFFIFYVYLFKVFVFYFKFK